MKTKFAYKVLVIRYCLKNKGLTGSFKDDFTMLSTFKEVWLVNALGHLLF